MPLDYSLFFAITSAEKRKDYERSRVRWRLLNDIPGKMHIKGHLVVPQKVSSEIL